MAGSLQLPIIDLASSDCISTSSSIRQACMNCGFFYLTNHGVEGDLLCEVLEGNKKFFELPLEEKMKLARKENRGYTPLYAENLDPSSSAKGDSKESFYIGSLEDTTNGYLNQWPPDGSFIYLSFYLIVWWNALRLAAVNHILQENGNDAYGFDRSQISANPQWRLHGRALQTYVWLLTDVCLSLDELLTKNMASNAISSFSYIQLHVYRWEVQFPKFLCFISQIMECRAFIVNIGDMMERWTNGLFRSTLHRVMPTGQMRYSVIISTL
ncbi:UPF0676 protein C1494.01-like [Olea europaea var. sylvestris]|uniref:UPF0676 protein C1494.01-like n=1 Tax=Olea europaea var. sylvestris TaxID=158386 RepID=UPI000C1D3AF5|nr:UPF0676 protein C1494.01-like [Olea europaea var. sylvestris]